MSIRKGSNIIAAYGSGTGGHADYINNQNLASEITRFYDWIGTLEEYEEQEIAELHPEWVCFITDDNEGGESVYTKTEMDTLLNAKLSSNDTEYIAHQSMPSNEYIDLTLGASGTEYIAPADGYVCLIKESGVANEYVSIQTSDGTGLDHVCFSTGGGQRLSAMMHVSRHQKYKTWWTATGSFTRYVFVYANGAI